MEQLNFTGTEHCGLCRLKFPSATPQGVDAWQSDFRAVLRFKSKGGKTRIEVTNAATFGDMLDDATITLEGFPQIQVTIMRSLQRPRGWAIDQSALCFHDWCYDVLRWGVGDCTKSAIYKLTRTLLPESSILDSTCQDHGRIDPRGVIPTFVSLAEHSNLQPPSVLKLPSELRRSIWEYVGPTTAYAALILVACETTRLARALSIPGSRKITLRQGICFSVKMIPVFGTEYIRNFSIGGASKEDPNVLGFVTEVRVAVSLGGICAIKIFGIDWNTGWLGRIPVNSCVWYGTAHGPISRLDWNFNYLNCTNISNPAIQIFWDQPEAPLSLCDPDAVLFDFHRDIIGSRRAEETHQQRFLRYLPLFRGSEYIRGLTVYVSGSSIIGLEAHFAEASHLSGSRRGCAIHLPLLPREWIAYVWLRVVDSRSVAFAAPALTIQTSFGRLHSFGSHILPSLVVNNGFRWILLKSKGRVSGFYYENPASSPTIMRLGITSDDTSHSGTPLMPQYAEWGFPSPPIAGPNAGLFLSVAHLDNLKRVELCRVGSRCTGLLIHYLDSSIAVLGQWNTSRASQLSCVFDSGGWSAGPPIYFGMAKHRHRQIVTDIVFSDKFKAAPGLNYQEFSMGQHIAWWFSKFYDVIYPWEGQYLRIPEGSKMLQKEFIHP